MSQSDRSDDEPPPPGSGRITDLFRDRETYFRTFEQRRSAYEAQVAAYRARRAALEAERAKALADFEEAFSTEISTSRAALAEVAPIEPREVDEIPLRRAAYSDRMSALMAKLSLLAYVDFGDQDRRPVLTAALEHGELKLLGWFCVEDTEAIVVEAPNFIAVAFRGTTTALDRKTDLKIGVRKVQVPGHKREVRVHAGFYDAFHKVELGLRGVLMATAPEKPIFLTGHSLGGALALVGAAAFSGGDELGARIAAVYTYGAPRVGGATYQAVVKAPHYRVINKHDLVPLVPPSWLNGYRHTGDALLLSPDKLKPAPARFALMTVFLALGSLLLWPFARSLLILKIHDIALYASRLDVIARERGRWS